MFNRTDNQEKFCFFCKNNIKFIDYKDSELLNNFINFQGKIFTTKRSGACSKHQRLLTNAIKQARTMAILSPSNRQVK